MSREPSDAFPSFWSTVAMSLVVTPVALAVGVMSAGAGHGDYVLARILFPYTMLSALLTGAISNLFVLVVILQFPVYGLIISLGIKAERLGLLGWSTLIVHFLAVAACFFVVNENF